MKKNKKPLFQNSGFSMVFGIGLPSSFKTVGATFASDPFFSLTCLNLSLTR